MLSLAPAVSPNQLALLTFGPARPVAESWHLPQLWEEGAGRASAADFETWAVALSTCH